MGLTKEVMSRQPLFGPSLPGEVYTNTVFVKWCNDGRDSNLVSISLDVYNHMLVVKTTKDSKKTFLHINQLKVIINYSINLFQYYYCHRLCAVGNSGEQAKGYGKDKETSQHTRGGRYP